jgi:hypothetical protein
VVNTFDKVYEWYKFYTGRIPTPWFLTLFNNKLTIATGVPATCGAGCGYIGFTGIEIQNNFWNDKYINNLITLDNGLYDQTVFYEFGRNFWFTDAQFRGNQDQGLLFMDGAFAIFMRFLTMEKIGVKGAPFFGTQAYPFNFFKNEVLKMITTYCNGPYTFDNTFKIDRGVPNGFNGSCSDLMASMLYDLKAKLGDKWLENIWKKAQTKAAATSIQSAVDNFIISCAEAAELNLTSLFESYYKWPVSPSVRTLLEGYPKYQDISYSPSVTAVPVNRVVDSAKVLVRLTSQAVPAGVHNGNITVQTASTTTQTLLVSGLTT